MTATEAGVITFRPQELAEHDRRDAPRRASCRGPRPGSRRTQQNAEALGDDVHSPLDCNVRPGSTLGTGSITLAKPGGRRARGPERDALQRQDSRRHGASRCDAVQRRVHLARHAPRGAQRPQQLRRDRLAARCSSSDGGSTTASDVWYTYKFSSNCPGNVVFSTCGSSFPAKLSVYSGGRAQREQRGSGCAARNLDVLSCWVRRSCAPVERDDARRERDDVLRPRERVSLRREGHADAQRHVAFRMRQSARLGERPVRPTRSGSPMASSSPPTTLDFREPTTPRPLVNGCTARLRSATSGPQVVARMSAVPSVSRPTWSTRWDRPGWTHS